MKANELRVQNWVTSEVDFYGIIAGKPFQLKRVGDVVDEWADMGASDKLLVEQLEPIPLTEEWVDRMEWDTEAIRITKNDIGVWIVEMAWSGINVDTDWRIIQTVMEVHTWQNLYFALTDEELIIKAS